MGFVPYVGVVADLANAGIYSYRGMGAEAAISAISAIPGLGDAVGLAYKAAKGIKAGAQVVGTTFRQVAKGVGSAVAQNGAEQTALVYHGRQESFEWEQMLGAAVSGGTLGPIAVGGGRLAGASATFAKRTAYLAAGSGAAGALGNASTQFGAMSAGRQTGFDFAQLGTSFAGGALGGALGQAAYDKTCFSAETPMIACNEQGWKRADHVQVDDYLASRDEHDPAAPVVWSRVEEVFVAQGEIWELEWQGRTIRTTAEHPFYVHELGWTPARELRPGQLLATMDGRYLPLETIASTGKRETVYNFRIADGHTYFVGTPQGCAALWAHNRCDRHHPVPKVIGGNKKQVKYSVDRTTEHTPFHSAFAANLNAAGFPLSPLGGRGNSAATFEAHFRKYKGSQRAVFDVLIRTARDFDVANGTQHLAYVKHNIKRYNYNKLNW